MVYSEYVPKSFPQLYPPTISHKIKIIKVTPLYPPLKILKIKMVSSMMNIHVI